jgi:glycosyltransferase involved in cell wall biosynthesis
MYCGACTRDVVLARGLLARGHTVQIIPLYTPLRTDRDVPPVTPVFYNGVLCYIEQFAGLFRCLPRFLERALSSAALLRVASRFALSTRPSGLGALTVSVLSGAHGRQARELSGLVEYLKSGPPPDLIRLPNSLLSGLAEELRAHLRCPIVCALQGEDSFVEALPEPHRAQALDLLRKNARAIDLFIATGEAYTRRMAALLGVPAEKIRVVRTGLDAESFPVNEKRPRAPFVLGYLSVITPRKGLDVAVAAFRLLAGEQHRDVRLLVAGKVLDKRYWREIERKVSDAGLAGRFEYLGEVDLAGKLEFFRRCSAFTLPSRIEEARGLAVMEALSRGLPVVVPQAGIFPEMLARTGGGALFPPGDAAALAREVARLQDDPAAADELGRSGAAGVRREYSAAQMVAGVEEVYAGLLAARPA